MRRRYITHPRFQYSFTFAFVLGVLAILHLVGGLGIATLHFLCDSPVLTSEQITVIQSGGQSLLRSLTLIGFLMILLFSLLGFVLSCKFVGPLYRLEGWLEMVLLGGKSPPLRLRPGDELAKMTQSLNRIVEGSSFKMGRD